MFRISSGFPRCQQQLIPHTQHTFFGRRIYEVMIPSHQHSSRKSASSLHFALLIERVHPERLKFARTDHSTGDIYFSLTLRNLNICVSKSYHTHSTVFFNDHSRKNLTFLCLLELRIVEP
ncbi:hypothetical protein CEXT_245081 [Caerostris extrusa]|uniref:Uncharacterized protein n=1 Tax=Caerostris extrusa TaxID=172846 RepID=A0AAV4XF89_CAEEX|nr:hypothetical protein CEXT_245081 [Caerostris extrusa]